MNPYQVYREQQTIGWSRIDLLLALYDGAIERLEQTRQALARADRTAAAPLLVRSQRIVLELAASLDFKYGEVSKNLHRLYLFVMGAMSGTKPDIEAALAVLRVLREGLEGIRPEAIQLERSGAIPPADEPYGLRATG